jgi:hypothetical protein
MIISSKNLAMDRPTDMPFRISFIDKDKEKTRQMGQVAHVGIGAIQDFQMFQPR